jgi:nucleoside permease NupC
VDETLKVAELMGMKTVLNEFIAYQRLSEMILQGTLTGVRFRGL